MPIIILGGILSGIFTPTAAAIGLPWLWWASLSKRLSIKDLPEMLLSSAIHTGVILLIVSTAAVFSWLMATEKLPQQIANIIMSVSSNRYVVLAMINIFLLFVGCFMDQAASLIILVPILLPKKHLDIHHSIRQCQTNLCIDWQRPRRQLMFVACSTPIFPRTHIQASHLFSLKSLSVLDYLCAFSCLFPGCSDQNSSRR